MKNIIQHVVDLTDFYSKQDKIDASYSLSDNIFLLNYTILKTNFPDVIFNKNNNNKANSSSKNQRENNLWLETCFECFLILQDNTYLEINLSPDKKYNIYHFDSYRNGMKESQLICLESLSISNNKKYFNLEAKFDINNINIKKIQICAILKGSKEGLENAANQKYQYKYFAINHTLKENPDFHDLSKFSNIIY